MSSGSDLSLLTLPMPSGIPQMSLRSHSPIHFPSLPHNQTLFRHHHNRTLFRHPPNYPHAHSHNPRVHSHNHSPSRLHSRIPLCRHLLFPALKPPTTLKHLKVVIINHGGTKIYPNLHRDTASKVLRRCSVTLEAGTPLEFETAQRLDH